MKRTSPFVFAFAFLAMVGNAVAVVPVIGSVELDGAAWTNTPTYDVSVQPSVKVVSTRSSRVRADVWGDYTPGGEAGAVQIELSKSSTTYTCTLPVVPAGQIYVRFTAYSTSNDTASSEIYSYFVVDTPPEITGVSLGSDAWTPTSTPTKDIQDRPTVTVTATRAVSVTARVWGSYTPNGEQGASSIDLDLISDGTFSAALPVVSAGTIYVRFTAYRSSTNSVSSEVFKYNAIDTPPAISAVQIGSSAWTSTPSCDVLSPPTVTVTASNAEWIRAEVWGDYTPNGEHGAVHCYLDSVSATKFSGTLPVDRSGTISVRFTACKSSGVMATSGVYTYIATENTTSADALGPARRPVWGSSGEWYKAWSGNTARSGTVAGWTGTNVRMESSLFLQLWGAVQTTASLHSQISTEDSISAGTIWFKARGWSQTRDMTLIVEDVSGSGRNIVRTPIKTITIPARTSASDLTWTQYQIVLQANTAGRLVFRNATMSDSSLTLNAEQIHITDIVIAPPQPDVKIMRFESDFEPGFPSVQDPVTFRCAVSNVFDIAPAQYITPKLVWRQNGGDWNVTPMTNVLGRTVQESGEYAISLTEHVPGSFEYFFRADFTGYTPSFEAVNPVIVSEVSLVRFSNRADVIDFNVGASAAEGSVFVVDSNGDEHDFDDTAKAMLSRSPAYSYDLREWQDLGCNAANIGDYVYREDGTLATSQVSDWELSHRFDFENLVGGWLVSLANCSANVTFEDTYEYFKPAAAEGIRRFRSRYGTLTLSVTNHPAATEEYAVATLDPTYSMQQVGDYTWQALIRVTNAVDIASTVHGEWEYNEEYGVFSYNTYQWGEIDQEETAINPPMAGELYRLGPLETATGWAPVRTQINYSGFLMFRFCTTNGAYQVRRAAWQDFNAWQADDDWFSRSFGLYGTQTFDNDVESVSPTIDDEATIIGLNSRTPVSDSLVTTRTTRGGMSAQNFWYVKERVRDIATNYTSTVGNFAWRLSSAQMYPGSLETTGESRGDGRGTLKMRVRAGTGDDRAVLYNGSENAPNWQNKRFVGKFSEAKLSEGLPSFSVYGYWQDADNYWEARVTQTNLLLGTGTTAGNSQLAGLVLELWKKEDGKKTRIAFSANTTPVTGTTVPGWYDASKAILDRKGDTILVLDLYTEINNGTTQVKPRAILLHNDDFKKNNTTSEPGCANGGAKTVGAATHACYLRPTAAVQTTVDHGTVGYNTRDCEATVVPYVFEWQTGAEPSNSSTTDEIVKANGSANVENKAVSMSGASSWVAARDDGSGSAVFQGNRPSYVRNTSAFQGESPWSVTVPAGGTALPGSPATIKRDVHDANYRILVYRTEEKECSEWGAPVGYDDTAEWDGRWDSIHGHAGDGIKTVSSFDWTEVEIPMSLWDDTFIRIEAVSTNAAGVASTADLMVDDISCTAWTGQTVWQPDYDDDYVNEEKSWKGLYAAVEQDIVGATTNRYYVLDRTRMNPGAERESPQSVTTPLLENGVGDLYFSYKAEVTNVAFVVEWVKGDGTAEEYFSTTAAVDTASAWIPKYVPVLTNEAGRIRIRTKRLYADEKEENEIFGRLLVDGLRATDYPNEEGSAWESYNVLVSTFRSPGGIHADLEEREYLAARFDGPANPSERRSAVLNDSADADTLSELELGEHNPYIQTPRITTGVGEVSFWYRRSPDSADQVSSIKLYVAEAASPVDSDWRLLTVDDLNTNSATYAEQRASLEALSSVGNDEWVYFTSEFFQQDYKVLRIYGETNGANRVMLDNILVTEPVRASIDVGSITFNPTCPLATGDVSVRVKLVNPRMQPENLRVKLEYYVGTNVWGYGNPNVASSAGWWNDPAKRSVTLTNTVTRLANGTERVNLYEFASSNSIPHFNVDDVVQYCAVVEYDGVFAAPVYSATQERSDNTFWFENPEWYEPTDLNKTFGTEDNPVAHYWVFSCPPGSVWINEFRNITNGDLGTRQRALAAQANQFVEIIGPQDASLAGWTLEHFGEESSAVSLNYVKWTNTMDRAAAFAEPNNASADNPKGWGFWVLGCSGIAGANQELFPSSEAADHDYLGVNYGVMHYRGAMRLRRSMGAYEDKVAWAYRDNEISTFLADGFRRAAFSRNGDTLTYVVNGTDDKEIKSLESTDWERGNVSVATIGGYNSGEEEFLWVAGATGGGGDDPDDPDHPDDPDDPDDPVDPTDTGSRFVIAVTDFVVKDPGSSNSGVNITFNVVVTNGVALASTEAAAWAWELWRSETVGSDAEWTKLGISTSADAYTVWYPNPKNPDNYIRWPVTSPVTETRTVGGKSTTVITGFKGLTAGADGTPSTYQLQVRYPATVPDALFYRIRSTKTEE